MSEENAKSETQPIRTEKDGEFLHSPDTGWKKGIRISGGTDGSFSDRNTGTPGTGPHTDFFSLLTGGIISQLITDAEDRLGQSQECIEWYEREKEENIKRLENLKKLQRLAEQQQQANGNQDSE